MSLCEQIHLIPQTGLPPFQYLNKHFFKVRSWFTCLRNKNKNFVLRFPVRQNFSFVIAVSDLDVTVIKILRDQATPTGKRLLLRLIIIYESCAHDASTRLLLYIPQLSESRVTCDVSEHVPEQRAGPLGSEQNRTGMPRRWSRGVSDTGQLWLFPLAAAPTWSGGMSWTARLPPAATRIYLAGSQTSSTASALRCVAVVLHRVTRRLIHRFCVLLIIKYYVFVFLYL